MKEINLILKLGDEKNVEKIIKEIKGYLISSDLCSEVEVSNYEKVSTIPFHSKSNKLFSQRVQEVLEFVKTEYTENISLEQAASKLFLSKYHFEKIFKAEIGMPFKKHLNYFRLCKAAEILRSNTSISVTNLCFEVGFSELSNFIKIFKDFIGCSPGNFKNCFINPEVCELRKKSRSHKLGIYSRKLSGILGYKISDICFTKRTKITEI
jgi:YesN/AraC family two-component response regulator